MPNIKKIHISFLFIRPPEFTQPVFMNAVLPQSIHKNRPIKFVYLPYIIIILFMAGKVYNL